jgi:hypothetical protein
MRALLMGGSISFAFLVFSILSLIQVYVLLFTTPVPIPSLLDEKIHATRGISILCLLLSRMSRSIDLKTKIGKRGFPIFFTAVT